MITRRALLGMLAAGTAMGRAMASELPRERLSMPANPSGTPGLLLAGDHSAMADRWSPILPAALAQGFGLPAPLPVRNTVGQDGVTGANLFDSQFASDGMMALAAPGSALVSSLCGDLRIHFDYSRWLPLLLSMTVPVVIGRAQLHRSLGNFMRDRPVRIAVSTLTGIELPTVLAMSLFGLRPIPVTGLATPQAAAAALHDNQVDAIQITDPQGAPDTMALVESLTQAGFAPLFTLSTRTTAFSVQGQAVMGMEDRLRQDARSALGSLLYAAWKPLAGAASVDLALVLPMLTQAATLARWRTATAAAMRDGAIQAMGHDTGRTLLTGTDATQALQQISGDTTTIMALRRWLAAKLPTWRLD
ncbi:hypothetical protein CFR78_07045 [Komagataeibacter rhaeticus]|uniref:Uncharacterized protein n=1 Tax=Komagataeibacter rhaeticus TaxID=215221 RepID=A0A181C8C8_9PROT|nr:hypothetical protein [Komagataeibacter rhaeticus]ATU73428.1 hypothetical protein CT154_12000 [Komagataeibacter xylinus]EGG75987.1 hypothetical protein SXCC_03347 [Gluconacetobacter sp. SXCC-1]KDU94366.1 hypothetical protein GLUCORHAEAF1_13915 [Komagataeibacter rhaeticus AF1]MBL7240583.1 hypothetical protein [Komagataeibacter rhaeticus]PYD54131.1 hypothetical protein CFR78_07045 [Komagataeibacter rhaeticus]